MKTLESKIEQSKSLLRELDVSIFLRKQFDLPMDRGVVSTQKVTNGYGQLKEVRVFFDGDFIGTLNETETKK
jgi:hypothetical protein